MITEEVKKIINNSKFRPDLKQRLIAMLPSLNRYTLEGLGKEVSRNDSIIIAEFLVSLWENYGKLLNILKTKDESAYKVISNYLNKNFDKFNGEEEFYFLGFALDIRNLIDSSRIKFPQEQLEKILEFELRMFWYLPKEEFFYLLENQLLFLETRVNLFMHLKLAVWKNDWDFYDDFNKTLSDLLYKNKEKLGSSGKTVGDWIKAYFNFSSGSKFRTNVVEVAEFLIKDPTVKVLTKEERDVLSEVLKLYAWLQKPEIIEKEVLDYEEELLIKQREKDEELNAIDDNLAKNFEVVEVRRPSPSLVPARPKFNNLKPIDEIQKPQIISSLNQPNLPVKPVLNITDEAQINIDRKLEELEKRTGKN